MRSLTAASNLALTTSYLVPVAAQAHLKEQVRHPFVAGLSLQMVQVIVDSLCS